MPFWTKKDAANGSADWVYDAYRQLADPRISDAEIRNRLNDALASVTLERDQLRAEVQHLKSVIERMMDADRCG